MAFFLKNQTILFSAFHKRNTYIFVFCLYNALNFLQNPKRRNKKSCLEQTCGILKTRYDYKLEWFISKHTHVENGPETI